jgi:tungstate transport system ATP-binding protein
MTLTGEVSRAAVVLSLHDCSVQFDGFVALDRVSLTIRQGERVALVGANGSGKTSLLRSLHGLVPCSGGRREQPLSPQGVPWRQSMLFQKPFVLSLSARTNVQLALWLQGERRSDVRRSKALLALDRVGLKHQAEQRATTLSGGQLQRLALARAWALQPDLLLLDEPTASLDPASKREVEALMAAFADDGLAVVFSTHNLGQVKRLAQRVVYLEDGRVCYDGSVADFFGSPLPAGADAFVRAEWPSDQRWGKG